jgi:MFS family permease
MTSVAGSAGSVAAREWRGNWPIVFTALLGNLLLSMPVLSMGAFMAPLEHQFGWTRAESAIGVSLYAVVGALSSPLIGIMLDKWGARRMAIPGIVLTGLIFALFATNNGSVLYWIVLWLALSAANQLIITMVWSAAVSDVFFAGRGLALGVTFCGNGLSAFVAPLLANYLIEHVGWQLAYIWMGLGVGGLVAAVAWFMFFDRHERQRRGIALAETAQPVLTGLSVRQGVRSPTFAKLIVAIFMAFFFTMGLVPHLIPILSEGGLARDTAVAVSSVLGVTMIVGKLGIGALADRIHARLLLAFCCGMPAIPCAMFILPADSLVIPVIAVGILGVAIGSQLTMTVYLATRYFGMRCFGRLFGFIGSAVAAASAIAPWAGGQIFDMTHSYAALLIAGIPVSLLSSLLLLSLGPYPSFDQPAPAAEDPAFNGGRPATALP